MLNVGPPGSTCWISSVVQLPMFYEPGATLYGTMTGVTSEVYETMQFEVRQNRDITIKPGLTKYKIELCVNGEIDEIVGISLQPFNPNAIMSEEFAQVKFFPIYAHCGRECYLYIDSINDFFRESGIVCSAVGSQQITSAMRIIQHLDQFFRPNNPDTGYDFRYARLSMQHRLIEFIMMELNIATEAYWGNNETTLRIAYGILDNQLPLSLQIMGNVRYVAQLRPFLNPYGNVPSDIAKAAIVTVQNNFDRIKSDLLINDALPDKVGDIFMTEAEDFSYTGKWLSLIFQNEFSDFQFPMRQNDRDVSDVYLRRCHEYEGFRHSFQQLYCWNDLSSCLVHSLQLYEPLERGDLTVQRSWLEDVVVRDANGIIVMYADMVLLILMCAEGLINECIVNQCTCMFTP